MVENDRAFVNRYFVFFVEKLLLQLHFHNVKDGLKKGKAEYHDRVVFLEAIAKARHETVAHPTGEVEFVGGERAVVHDGTLTECRRILELPHVQTVQKQFACFDHILKLVVARFAVLAEYVIHDYLRNWNRVSVSSTAICSSRRLYFCY